MFKDNAELVEGFPIKGSSSFNLIETLAESILNSKEILTVVDNNNEIVGSLNPTKVIKVIFGK